MRTSGLGFGHIMLASFRATIARCWGYCLMHGGNVLFLEQSVNEMMGAYSPDNINQIQGYVSECKLCYLATASETQPVVLHRPRELRGLFDNCLNPPFQLITRVQARQSPISFTADSIIPLSQSQRSTSTSASVCKYAGYH